jgi:hypothetical protein
MVRLMTWEEQGIRGGPRWTCSLSGLQPRERNGRILNTGKALGVLEREVGPLSVQEIMGGYQVRVEQQPSLRDSAAPHESGVSQIQCRRWTSLPKQH